RDGGRRPAGRGRPGPPEGGGARPPPAPRLVFDHEVDTVAALRDADPIEEPLPPLLLIADATAVHERARIAALLTQGQRLDIHGVLLGVWADGNTVHVDADGATRPADGEAARHGGHPADVGRLAVGDPTETAHPPGAAAPPPRRRGPPPPPRGRAGSPTTTSPPLRGRRRPTTARAPTRPADIPRRRWNRRRRMRRGSWPARPAPGRRRPAGRPAPRTS